jgi:hypothetical protein
MALKLRRLLFENLDTKTGSVTLYHFSSIQPSPDSFLLDPEYGKVNPRSYSVRDYASSGVPRLWFYTDPTEAEKDVKMGSTLYTTEVSANDICQLSDIIKTFKEKNSGMPVNSDEILRVVSGRQRLSLDQLPYDPSSESYQEDMELLLKTLDSQANKTGSVQQKETILALISEIESALNNSETLTTFQRTRIRKLFLGTSKEVKTAPLCKGIRFKQSSFDNVIWFEPIMVYKAEA